MHFLHGGIAHIQDCAIAAFAYAVLNGSMNLVPTVQKALPPPWVFCFRW